MNDFYLYRHAWISAPHYNKQLSDEQCDALLKQGGWLVRNTYSFDQKESSDFWYVIKDSFGGVEELSPKERKKINTALNRFDYQIIDKAVVVEQGYEIAKKVYDSYAVKDMTINRKAFSNLLDGWDNDNHDFWGIFDLSNGKLIGIKIVKLFDIGCFYDMVWILPEYKHSKSYPYYGMYYKLNEYYLDKKRFKYVTDGSRSITEHSNIQPFLEHVFKFRKAYCKLYIHYKWWFGIIVRLLYPFRSIIPSRNVRAVLNMHGMQTK